MRSDNVLHLQIYILRHFTGYGITNTSLFTRCHTEFFLTKALHFLYLLNLSPTPTTSLSLTELRETKLTLNFMAPFFGIGSTVSRLQSHYETEIPGNHLIDLGMIKG